MSEQRARITAPTFVEGVLYQAALSRGGVLHVDSSSAVTHLAFAEGAAALERIAEENNVQPVFRIKPHRIYGDSPTLSRAFMWVTRFEGVTASVGDPVITVDATNEFAELAAERLPGPATMYSQLAKVVMHDAQRPFFLG